MQERRYGGREWWSVRNLFLPEKFHGQKSLAGYSSKGHKKLDATERLNSHTGKTYLRKGQLNQVQKDKNETNRQVKTW